jgi:hypothetical protein
MFPSGCGRETIGNRLDAHGLATVATRQFIPDNEPVRLPASTITIKNET